MQETYGRDQAYPARRDPRRRLEPARLRRRRRQSGLFSTALLGLWPRRRTLPPLQCEGKTNRAGTARDLLLPALPEVEVISEKKLSVLAALRSADRQTWTRRRRERRSRAPGSPR